MPKVYNTGDIGVTKVNALIYGLAGAGKTPIASTLPNAQRTAMVVSSEPGLLSLQEARMPYVQVQTVAETREVLQWLGKSAECRAIKDVYFDSISAIADTALGENRRKYKNDARKFSPETVSEICSLVLDYCNLPQNVWMTCKATATVLENGTKWIEPYAALPKLAPNLPYYFDNVLYLLRGRDAANVEYVALCCRENVQYSARNRSGKLDLWEPANLSHIIAKSTGV